MASHTTQGCAKFKFFWRERFTIVFFKKLGATSNMAARAALAPLPNGQTSRLSMAPQRKSLAPQAGMLCCCCNYCNINSKH